MFRSSLLIGVFAMTSFCTITAAFDSSNDDVQDLDRFMPPKDIIIDTMHGYLREEEKRLATIRKYLKDYSKEHKEEEKIVEEDDDPESFREKEKVLCSGEGRLSAGLQKKLRCRYVDHGIPSLKIAPFKEEEAYLDPRIVLYHNVIYNEEIETFKRLSKPQLEFAKTINSTTGVQEASKQRVAKSAWIGDNENTHVQLVTRRVEDITGLAIDTAESFQVAYYGIGGYYLTHKDFYHDARYFLANDGNRISTVLFYMNDVAEGGATIFTKLNVTIWPRKGSAAFWYNMKQDGEGDYSTMHAACPVLSGTKWIATKWIHEKGQEILKPCTILGNELRHQ